MRKLQSEHLLDLEGAVVAVKNEKGRVRLHQSVNLNAYGAIIGGLCGSLTGLNFLNAAAGAASGALTDGDQRSLHKRVVRYADSWHAVQPMY